MTTTTDQYITIGTFGKPFGIHGWITVHPASDHTANIVQYQPWAMETKMGWQAIQIAETKIHAEKIVVYLADVNTPEAAQPYNSKKIAILRNQLPKLQEDEYYWSDLEGLAVINQNNIELGHIAYLFRTGSNDVIVVEGNKRRLIPFMQKEIITHIDLKNQCVHVQWDPEF